MKGNNTCSLGEEASLCIVSLKEQQNAKRVKKIINGKAVCEVRIIDLGSVLST